MGRRKFGTDFQLMFRILKALLFLGFMSVMTVLFVVWGLTVSDLFAALLAFLPTGWAILLVSSAIMLSYDIVCLAQLSLNKLHAKDLVLIHLYLFPKIGQSCRPMMKGIGFWESIKELARGYEYIMGLVIFMPIAILSWFPFVSEFQTRLLFNQAFSRGLQISMILSGRKDTSLHEGVENCQRPKNVETNNLKQKNNVKGEIF